MSQSVVTPAPTTTHPPYAVPLLLLAIAVAGAMPFYVLNNASEPGTVYSTSLGGIVDTAIGLPVNVYWLLALPIAYGVIAAWAARRARRGDVVHVTSLVVTGLLGVVAVLGVQALSPSLLPGDLTGRSLTPLFSVVAAIAVWAATERSIGLGVTAVVVAATALVANLYDAVNVLDLVGITPGVELGLVVNAGLVAVTLAIASAVFAAGARSSA